MDDGAVTDPIEADGARSDVARISREMVRLYKVNFGRGPTRARTDYAGDDLLILHPRGQPDASREAAGGDG